MRRPKRVDLDTPTAHGVDGTPNQPGEAPRYGGVVAEPKQVIVLRKDLGMRKGKMIAQGAHASLAAVLRGSGDRLETAAPGRLILEVDPATQAWLQGSFTKIVVGVNSEEELVAVHEAAVERGLTCALIRDAGRTEFGGVPTLTACAVGPGAAETVDAVTGDFGLL